MGVEPQLAQLFAHGHHLVNIGQVSTCLGELLHHTGRNLFKITVHPALGVGQNGFRRQCGERGDFLFEFQAQLAGVIGHHFVTVGNHSLEGFFVSNRLDIAKSEFGRRLFNTSQSKKLQDPDVGPAQIKLIRFDRQLGRCGIGVVVVVQLFPTNDDAPWHKIGTGVWRFKVAISPVVPSTIDDACSGHRDPHHLHSPNAQTQSAKQSQIDDQHDRDALP